MQQSVHVGVGLLIVLTCTAATVAFVVWAYHRETHKRLSHRLLAVFIAWFLVFYTITVFLVDPQI